MNDNTMDWNLFDETYSKFGLLKVLREGNGFEWRVFGVNNFERPLFVGKAGQFEEARKQGEDKLYKDLKQIFWILSQMSEKERKEGEPADAELIERAIRAINGGQRSQAIVFLRDIIKREKAEGEPGDARQLELALALLMAEPPDLGKGHSEPAQPPIERPEMKTASKKVRFTRALAGIKKDTTYEPCPTCSSGHLGLKGGKPRDLKCPDCGGTGQKVTRKLVEKDRYGFQSMYGGYALVRQDPATIAIETPDMKRTVHTASTISAARAWIDAHPMQKSVEKREGYANQYGICPECGMWRFIDGRCESCGYDVRFPVVGKAGLNGGTCSACDMYFRDKTKFPAHNAEAHANAAKLNEGFKTGKAVRFTRALAGKKK